MSSVWCQVVIDGANFGHPVEIDTSPKNIGKLCDEVKTKMAITLHYCDATQLTVFPAGTTNFTDTTQGYKRWISCPDSAGENPLIVVAPRIESGTCVVVLL